MRFITQLKNRLTSKTYLAAVTLAIVTAIDVNSGFVSGLLPPEYRPFLLMSWPILMMTLRELTTTSINKENAN